jgi:hypothetical protein
MTKYTKEVTIAKLGLPVLLVAIIVFLNLISTVITFLENNVNIMIGLFILGLLIILAWIIRGTKDEEKEKKVIAMDTQEKILLLDLLLYDIKADWDFNVGDRQRDPRIWECVEILDSLNSEQLNVLPYFANIGLYLTGKFEGGIFGADRGGFEGLQQVHKLKLGNCYLSPQFKKKANELLRMKINL